MVNQEFLNAQEAYRSSIYAGEVAKFVIEPTLFLDEVSFADRRSFMDFFPTAIISSENGEPICIDTVVFHHQAADRFPNKLNGGDHSILLLSRDIKSEDHVTGFLRLRIDSGHGHLKGGPRIATAEKGIARRLLLMQDFVLHNPGFFSNGRIARKFRSYELMSIEVDNLNKRRLASIADTNSPEYAEALAQQDAWIKLFSREMGYRPDHQNEMYMDVHTERISDDTGMNSGIYPSRLHLQQEFFKNKRYYLKLGEDKSPEISDEALWNEAHEQFMRNITKLRSDYEPASNGGK